MPNRCVVFGCLNEPSRDDGVALHFIPFADDDRPQVKKIRKRWVDFVGQKRENWTPGRTASVCSKHFTPEDFERRFSLAPNDKKPMIPRLKN